MAPTVAEAVDAGIRQLEESSITDSSRLDSEILLSFVTEKSRAFLIANGDAALSEFEFTHFSELIADRSRGYPVAYLTGEKEFWSLDLTVNEKVLVPRPDTELLVERALGRITNDVKHILDLGTGSGAIGLALAKENPKCRVLATDFSSAAIGVATRNAERHQIENIMFQQADWFFGLDQQTFQIIVSNPPYIDPDDSHLSGEVRYEPQSALVSMEQGLADLRYIAREAPEWLSEGGWLMLEHGYQQGKYVREFLISSGFVNVQTTKDLGGNERITEGQILT